MKKKLLALLLCAAVCLTAGCGTKEKTSGGDTAGSGSQTAGFSRGKWNGDVFTSDFFGIKITLDPACKKENDQALAARNGLTGMSDDELIGAVVNGDGGRAYYEVLADYRDRGSVALTYSRVGDVSLDAVVRDNVDELKKSSQFTDVYSDSVKLPGKEQPCIYATFAEGTKKVYEVMVLYKTGEYFAVVTMSAFYDNELQDMIKNVLR